MLASRFARSGTTMFGRSLRRFVGTEAGGSTTQVNANQRGGSKSAVVALVSSFFGAGAGIFAMNHLQNSTDLRMKQNMELVPQADALFDMPHVIERHTFSKLYKQVSDSVVHIENPSKQGGSIGSGFIINNEGYVVTNAHVVDGNNSRNNLVSVTLRDGSSYDAKIVGGNSQVDIAVLHIIGAQDLKPVKIGSSADLVTGEWVFAVGSPRGLSQTITKGIISAVDRNISYFSGSVQGFGYIQTDTAINPGNSGGPLFDLDGKVIGVNTLKINGAEAIGLSIPIDYAIKVAEAIIDDATYVRPYIGAQVINIDDNLKLSLYKEFPHLVKFQSGILVPKVVPGSPADKGGLFAGDVIVEFNNRPVKNVEDIIVSNRRMIGRRVPVVVNRYEGGKIVTKKNYNCAYRQGIMSLSGESEASSADRN